MFGTLLSITAGDGCTVYRWLKNNGDRGELLVSGDCEVTVNGEKGALADLKAGDALEVSGNPATSIKATRAADAHLAAPKARKAAKAHPTADDVPAAPVHAHETGYGHGHAKHGHK